MELLQIAAQHLASNSYHDDLGTPRFFAACDVSDNTALKQALGNAHYSKDGQKSVAYSFYRMIADTAR
jgi:hypothetical protein